LFFLTKNFMCTAGNLNLRIYKPSQPGHFTGKAGVAAYPTNAGGGAQSAGNMPLKTHPPVEY
jgi:hypothetical protein